MKKNKKKNRKNSNMKVLKPNQNSNKKWARTKKNVKGVKL